LNEFRVSRTLDCEFEWKSIDIWGLDG